MEPSVFDEAAVILPALVPDELGEVRQYVRRYGMKVWLGDAPKAPRVHYEAQVIGPGAVAGAKVLAIEVGFHAEHTNESENEVVLATLLAVEKRWRKVVGSEPVAGPFLGRAEHWRRVSETWADPDLADGSLPFEIAARLTDYMTAFEPILRRPSPRRR